MQKGSLVAVSGHGLAGYPADVVDGECVTPRSPQRPEIPHLPSREDEGVLRGLPWQLNIGCADDVAEAVQPICSAVRPAEGAEVHRKSARIDECVVGPWKSDHAARNLAGSVDGISLGLAAGKYVEPGHHATGIQEGADRAQAVSRSTRYVAKRIDGVAETRVAIERSQVAHGGSVVQECTDLIVRSRGAARDFPTIVDRVSLDIVAAESPERVRDVALDCARGARGDARGERDGRDDAHHEGYRVRYWMLAMSSRGAKWNCWATPTSRNSRRFTVQLDVKTRAEYSERRDFG